jgi:hypothetical protein
MHREINLAFALIQLKAEQRNRRIVDRQVLNHFKSCQLPLVREI